MSTVAVQVDRVVKTFARGRVQALNGVSLAVAEGEALGLVGPNGAGKTTLLGCMLGLLRPDGGRVTIAGLAPDDLAIRARTGYLPERLVLPRWLTGRAFLEYSHALCRRPAPRRAVEVEAALARVGLEAAAASRKVRTYSRGMVQRLSLAQALIGEPRYLFLDEPLGGLDPPAVRQFRDVLNELKGRGVTIVLSSHQLDEVERTCDRVAFVAAGAVTAVESRAAARGASRILRVSFAEDPAVSPTTLAWRGGIELLEAGPRWARFAVADDDAAARLVGELAAAGLRIAEVAPEASHLESLFNRTATEDAP